MKVIMYSCILLMFVLSIPTVVFSSGLTFECGFIQEKAPGGKSNRASCSMDPDKVFTAYEQYPHDRIQHCVVSPVHHYTDLIDFHVTNEIISWKSKLGLTEAAKSRQKKYNIKQGDSEKEAERSVNAVHATKYSFKVFSHYLGQNKIYINSLTNKPYNEPKTQNVHIYNFGNDNEQYSLYIPEPSMKAILIQYSSEEDSSWVKMIFGTCRVSHK